MKSIKACSGLYKNKQLAENMTLREVMEFTRELELKAGGLSILLEKIVFEIEKLQEKDQCRRMNTNVLSANIQCN